MAAGGARRSRRPVPPRRPRGRRRHRQQGRVRDAPALLVGRGPRRRGASVHGYGDAVRLGLEQVPDAHDDEWIWLLHDDSNPAHDALEALLAGVAEYPEASVLGPKLREWPSLRRLLEVGVTISGTGRRETGLERGEYDQGQHDEVREVLTVNTAGMLVRRAVLEDLGGFDAQLPIFGNDIDFGWRAAAAGHRTLVVPQAIVFHAEAAHRGLRTTPLTGSHNHLQERRGALWTGLANTPSRSLPWQVVRLFFGSLLRALGLLLTRQLGPALDELAAVGSVYRRPGQLRTARRERAVARTADDASVRRLLAPAWVPYRHGLDAVWDVVAALSPQSHDVAVRRRAAAQAADAGVPVATHERGGGLGDDEDDDLAPDDGLLARFITSPVAIAVTLFLVAVAVATRNVWGPVSGGALPAAPADAGEWWRLHTEHWHPLLQGTDVPAPAYVPVLAGLGTLLGGSASAAMSALLVSPCRSRVGGVATAARGRTPGQPAGGAALAARVGIGLLRARDRDERRVDRGALRDRGGGGAAPVGRSCGSRVRRPGSRPATPCRVAHRPVAGPRGRLRAGHVGVRRGPDPRAVRRCGRDRRSVGAVPVGGGPGRDRFSPCRPRSCCLVAAHAAAPRRVGPAVGGGAPARRDHLGARPADRGGRAARCAVPARCRAPRARARRARAVGLAGAGPGVLGGHRRRCHDGARPHSSPSRSVARRPGWGSASSSYCSRASAWSRP